MTDIIKGWLKHANVIHTTQEEKDLGTLRLNECGKCENLNVNWLYKAIDSTIGNTENDKVFQGASCALCGCNLQAKVLIKEQKCPIGKW